MKQPKGGINISREGDGSIGGGGNSQFPTLYIKPNAKFPTVIVFP
jgi:hypothetical protein